MASACARIVKIVTLQRLPVLGWDETGNVPYIAGSNHRSVPSVDETLCLCRQNDIAVQLSWISSRLTARPQTCPERCSLPHRRRIKGKVVKSLRQQVKSADTRCTVQMQELATHFVVDNLWDDQAMPSAQHAR